jgi:hypothetical protein
LACNCRRIEAGESCVLAGDRDVDGPLAAALVAGCRFAFAEGFGFGRAPLVLFGFALAGALLFGFALTGALLFGGALAAGVTFLGLPRFLGVATLCAARGASVGALAAGFRGFADARGFTARGPLAGAARGVLAGASRPRGVV